MGDWADCYEAFGYDISRIPDSAYKRTPQKVKKVTISVRVSKEDREKYMRLGGEKWLKQALSAAQAKEGKT